MVQASSALPNSIKVRPSEDRHLRVFVSHGPSHNACWLPKPMRIVDTVEQADIVMFTGGVDVDPAIYGEPRGRYTQDPSPDRDARDMRNFSLAKALGIPMVGICRGAQLLCVMNGGRLIQDQDNGHPSHLMFTESGKTYSVSSDHHQAAFPWGIPEMRVMGWTRATIGSSHLDGNNQEIELPEDGIECEDVFYPKTLSLGIQSHPEWLAPDDPAVIYHCNLVKELLLK